MRAWTTGHTVATTALCIVWIGVLSSTARANVAVVVPGVLALTDPGTVYVRDFSASGSGPIKQSTAGGPPAVTDAVAGLYSASADFSAGTFKALSIYPNAGAFAGTGPIDDPTFTWIGPGPHTFGLGDFSAHLDGTYSYGLIPGAGFGASAQATLAIDGVAGPAVTYTQHTTVEDDATGARKLTAANDACSAPSQADCVVTHSDYQNVDATLLLPSFTVAAGQKFQIDASLFVEGTGGPMTEDFSHTDSLSLVLPPGVSFVNETNFPVTWISAAVSVPAPPSALVMAPALVALAMARSRRSTRA